MSGVVPVAVLRPIVERWLADFETPEDGYHRLATNSRLQADSWRKRFSAVGWWAREDIVGTDADEFLTAADLTHLWYGELGEYAGAPLPKISAKVRLPGETGRIKRHSKAALLTRDQVFAVHKLHIDGGLSMREIARRGWEQWGYASPKSCLNSLCDLLASYGLERRDRIEATIAASTTHGRGSRSDKAAYKRWHRRAYGPWPSDGTDEERQERFDVLRANAERRAA